MLDLARCLEVLVPSANYSGAFNDNTQTEYERIRWKDSRTKPTWEQVQAVGIQVEPPEDMYDSYRIPHASTIDVGGIRIGSGLTITPEGVVNVNPMEVAFSAAVAVVADSKPSGYDGGTFSSGAWRTRDLNSVLRAASWLTLNDNSTFTLVPGIYYFDASAPAVYVNGHKCRIRSLSGNSVMLYGTSEYNGYSNQVERSYLRGVAEINTQSIFTLEHYAEKTRSTTGFGYGLGIFGVPEIYSVVTIFKLG
jgi:hypothetical protein